MIDKHEHPLLCAIESKSTSFICRLVLSALALPLVFYHIQMYALYYVVSVSLLVFFFTIRRKLMESKYEDNIQFWSLLTNCRSLSSTLLLLHFIMWSTHYGTM